MKLPILCLLVLAGCSQFDPVKFNEDNIKIHKECEAAGLTTELSVGGNFLCRVPPKPTPKPGAVE